MTYKSETIAAIATPPGAGGISIIRISGPDSLSCLKAIFLPAKGQEGFCFSPRFMHYGRVLDSENQPLDEVLAVYMPGPHSATGEDVAEVHCHGGPAIAVIALDSVLERGCRLAEPGEFSKRAFLNGRIDLSQAEAVAEAIAAPTRQGIRLAEAKISGALANEVQELLRSVTKLRVQIVAAVDFSEDIDMLPRDIIKEQSLAIISALDKLLSSYKRARLWREGASVVLAGQVNAGKSSLLNALLGRERAIVSDIPGTTRDYIEESILIDGLALRIIDTAGLRKGGGIVESEGIKLSHKLAEKADLLVLVADAGKGLEEADKEFLKKYSDFIERQRLIIALNKIDLAQDLDLALIQSQYKCPVLALSARTGSSLKEFTKKMAAMLKGSEKELESDIAPNLRQSKLLKISQEEIQALLDELEAGVPEDILSLRLDYAVASLEEIIGLRTSDEILGEIFSSFCIGK